MMDQKIYDTVQLLARDMAESSKVEDMESYEESYDRLLDLCIEHEFGEKNHPFQWETLADFTNDFEESQLLYDKAVLYAEDMNLMDCKASSLFARAQRYLYEKDFYRAKEFALLANKAVKKTDDKVLQKEVSEFLVEEIKA